MEKKAKMTFDPVKLSVSHSMTHQYIRIIVQRFEVDGKKTEREIALYNLI